MSCVGDDITIAPSAPFASIACSTSNVPVTSGAEAGGRPVSVNEKTTGDVEARFAHEEREWCPSTSVILGSFWRNPKISDKPSRQANLLIPLNSI
jgi:hypothetical protein